MPQQTSMHPRAAACRGRVRITAAVLLSALLLHGGMDSARAQVSIADVPLFLTSSVDPNILFILDDSGSMHWELTPDELGSGTQFAMYMFPRVAGNYGLGDYDNNVPSFRDSGAGVSHSEQLYAAAMRSPAVNKSYYNPAITYRPWVRADGTEFPPSVPSAARHSPVRNTGTRNLTVDNTQSASWRHCTLAVNPAPPFGPLANCGTSISATRTFFPAVYFHHTGGSLYQRANYIRVEIRPGTPRFEGHGRENRNDCAGRSAAVPFCTYAEEIQNFANWYTYYRSRILASQGGIGRAFYPQSERMRVGFGSINRGSSRVDGVNTRTIILGVRPFAGDDRTNFFHELYTGDWPAAATPLRQALDDAGQYFSRTDNRGPWGAVPGSNDSSAHLTCRQSFSILMTDGYWNLGAAGTAEARLNVDGTAGPTISGPGGRSFTYVARSPFTDNRADTLADVAMHYWKRDLRPTLDNRVPTSVLNPAFWQHMVTYGVGLGVTGSIDPAAAFAAIGSGANITWPDPHPADASAAKLDDLLHAAVNGRGGFFSAADPDTFATELSGVLRHIVDRADATAAAAATSTLVAQADTLLYSIEFRSADWSGTLIAREVGADGTVGALKWDAEQVLNTTAPEHRRIFTRTPAGVSVALDWASLSPAQRAALAVNPIDAPASSASGADRVAWLRGTEHAGLRSRAGGGITRRIGDLVHSNPLFMTRRNFGNRFLPGVEGSSYTAFRSSDVYRNRPDVLFVGSNGGMLHAFHAGTPFVNNPAPPPARVMDPDGGKELFAFVPSELLLPGSSGSHAQINTLMRPDYEDQRRYFVDGSPALADVYWGSSTWRSVLLGSMGAGGRTVFALDVSDPENFGISHVLWEFRHADTPCVADPQGGSGASTACREIGWGVTHPKIVRLRDGRWAAVFGNGYNSASHRARLFVVDMRTGRLLYLLDTGVGSAGTPNGLAAPETTDWPATDLSLSRAYAGDLRGNLWRFDFTTTTPTVARLFSATDAGGTAQPITARPKLARLPGDPSRVVVLVGTGSFFRVGDDSVVSPQVQTLYGVFDRDAAPLTNTLRSDLLAQTITSSATDVTLGGVVRPAGDLRFVSTHALLPNHKGWRIDLPGAGERVISEATFPTGTVQRRVRFTTLIPSNDPCGAGRRGFIMDFDLLSGARHVSPVFDLNLDGVFNVSDNVGGSPVSGIGGGTGERLTVIRSADGSRDHIFAGDGTRPVDGRTESGSSGRQSWRQLR